MSAIAPPLETIISPSKICNWEQLAYNTDNKLILGQKRILSAINQNFTPACVIYPQTQVEMSDIITYASQNHWRILSCGSGSKLNWGGLVKDINIVVSSQRLNQIIEHAVGDLTITVEAGAKFAEIQEILAKSGQFIALDPAYPQNATIGGIVATGDTGSLRQRYGGVRDMLLGISFVRADGKIAKAGGRVVKNVAGYDLMKLFTGAFGTLGMITQVTFRVYPIPESSTTLLLTGTAAALRQVTKTLLASTLTPTAIDLLSNQLVKSLGIGNNMGLITRFQNLSASVQEQSARLLKIAENLGLQGIIYTQQDELALWQRLQPQNWAMATESLISCKIGVVPNAAVTLLEQLPSGCGLIHAGKGLGLWQWDTAAQDEKGIIDVIIKMRSLCESHGGFLSILEAPNGIKQKIDVWGYNGNALNLMQKIKQEFDVNNILNPARFVAGI